MRVVCEVEFFVINVDEKGGWKGKRRGSGMVREEEDGNALQQALTNRSHLGQASFIFSHPRSFTYGPSRASVQTAGM